MALQIRRGSTAQREVRKFLEGELIYDTDLNIVFIGDSPDGVTGTDGGLPVTTYTDVNSVNAIGAALDAGTHANISFTYTDTAINAVVTLDGGLLNVADDTTPQLGADLDLNSHDITGTGNINITGTATATSFSGPLTGDVTGNVSGTAATVTGAAQVAITSVGTLTSLAVTNAVTSGSVDTPSIIATGGTLTITPNTTFSGDLISTTGTSDLGYTRITGELTVNAAVAEVAPTITIDDSLNATASQVSALILNVLVGDTTDSGPALEFRIDTIAAPEEKIARILSTVTAGDGNQLRIDIWDGFNYVPSVQVLDNSVVINQTLVIKDNGFFNHAGELPIITPGTDISIVSEGNIITYGNILPGIEDGAVTGTYDIGSATQAYKDLYLAGVILTSVPAAAIGQAGDVAGMTAFDDNYIYRCSADYTDGLSPIWGRTAVTYSTW
jgi:hypothetical protein